MLFKKEEIRTIITSCIIFLLIKLISTTLSPVPNSTAALITAVIIITMNVGQGMSWIKVIAIIPAIIIITLELVIKVLPTIFSAIATVLVAILVIWIFFQYAFRAMDVYWGRCYPDRPRVDRMKKAFYVSLSIVLAVMLIMALSF